MIPSFSTDNVSVYIVTKDRPASLKKCLNSLIKQTQKPDEVMIVDNSQSASAREVVNQSACLSHILYFHKPKISYPNIRNFAIDQTSCNLVLSLDDDCIARRDWLTQMLRYHQKNPKYAAFSGKVVHVPTNSIYSKLITLIRSTRIDKSRQKDSILFLDTANCFINKRLMQRHRISFDPKMVRGSDTDYAIQVISKRLKVGFAKSAIVYHRSRGNLLDLLKQRSINAPIAKQLEDKWPKEKFYFYTCNRDAYFRQFLDQLKSLIIRKKFLQLLKLTLVVLFAVVVYELTYVLFLIKQSRSSSVKQKTSKYPKRYKHRRKLPIKINQRV